MKAAEIKQLVGKNIKWSVCLDPHRGYYREYSGKVLEVRGKNINVNGDWKWLPYMSHMEILPEFQYGKGFYIHKDFGIVKINDTCIELQKRNPVDTSVFVLINDPVSDIGESTIKEVTKALLEPKKEFTVRKSSLGLNSEQQKKLDELFPEQNEIVVTPELFFEKVGLPESCAPPTKEENYFIDAVYDIHGAKMKEKLSSPDMGR